MDADNAGPRTMAVSIRKCANAADAVVRPGAIASLHNFKRNGSHSGFAAVMAQE